MRLFFLDCGLLLLVEIFLAFISAHGIFFSRGGCGGGGGGVEAVT